MTKENIENDQNAKTLVDTPNNSENKEAYISQNSTKIDEHVQVENAQPVEKIVEPHHENMVEVIKQAPHIPGLPEKKQKKAEPKAETQVVEPVPEPVHVEIIEPLIENPNGLDDKKAGNRNDPSSKSFKIEDILPQLENIQERRESKKSRNNKKHSRISKMSEKKQSDQSLPPDYDGIANMAFIEDNDSLTLSNISESDSSSICQITDKINDDMSKDKIIGKDVREHYSDIISANNLDTDKPLAFEVNYLS